MKITYQGKTCIRAQYTRSQGLAPDHGYVEMPIESALEIKVQTQLPPFNPVGEIINFAPVTLNDIVAETVVEKRREIQQLVAQAGFFVAGQLIFEDEKTKNVIFDDIYLHPNGLEELLQDLAKADHSHGELRIKLTDVRFFWKDYGCVHGEYNVETADGDFFVHTLNRDNQRWSLKQVLSALIKALPGNPDFILDFDDSAMQAPKNLIWMFEKPARALAQILDRYPLAVALQSNNIVRVFRRYPEHKGLDLPITHKSFELKETRYNYVPHAVLVAGNPIRQNRTKPLHPVSLDEDGKIKNLYTVMENWGIAFAGQQYSQLLKEVWADEQSQYKFIEQMKNGKRRREIAKQCFFKWFQLPAAIEAPQTIRVWDLPIMNLVVLKTEPSLVTGNGDRRKNVAFASKSDRDEVEFIPPALTATRLVQRKYKSQTELIASINQEITKLKATIALQDRYLKEIGRISTAIEQAKPFIFRRNGALRPIEIIQIEQMLKTGILPSEDDIDTHKNLSRLRDAAVTDYNRKRLQLVKTFLEQTIGKLAAAIQKLEEDLKQIKRGDKPKYTDIENLKIWLGVREIISPSLYKIDEQRGLVMCSEPIGVSIHAFAPTREMHEYSNPGIVELEYSTEHKRNLPEDHIFFHATLNEAGAVRILENARIATQPKVIYDSQMSLYLDERGQSFNKQLLKERALELVLPIFDEPRQVVAFRYEYDGFWPIEPINDITAVTYSGDDVPLTRIDANDVQTRLTGKSIQRKENEIRYYMRTVEEDEKPQKPQNHLTSLAK